MIAYHGEQALKDACISRMREHREQDLLLRGTYAERTGPGDLGVFQGCAVGCLVGEALIKEFAHLGPKLVSYYTNPLRSWEWNSWANQLVGAEFGSAYRRYLGIPTAVALWEEAVFESDLCEDPYSWPERFLEAIPVGADLSGVDKALRALLPRGYRSRSPMGVVELANEPCTEVGCDCFQSTPSYARDHRVFMASFSEGRAVLDALRSAPVPGVVTPGDHVAAESTLGLFTRELVAA